LIKKGADMRRQRGAALIEAAIALPLFLLLVAGLIDFTTVLRQRQSMLQALARAERAAAAASATGGIQEQDLLLKAGAVYVQTLQESGVSLEEVALGGDSGEELFVLIGQPFEGFPAASFIFPSPPAFELRGIYLPHCFFCKLIGLDKSGLNAAFVAVRESAPTRTYGRPRYTVLAYFPNRSGDNRVQWVSRD